MNHKQQEAIIIDIVNDITKIKKEIQSIQNNVQHLAMALESVGNHVF